MQRIIKSQAKEYMNKWKYYASASEDSILSNHKEMSTANHIEMSIKSLQQASYFGVILVCLKGESVNRETCEKRERMMNIIILGTKRME